MFNKPHAKKSDQITEATTTALPPPTPPSDEPQEEDNASVTQSFLENLFSALRDELAILKWDIAADIKDLKKNFSKLGYVMTNLAVKEIVLNRTNRMRLHLGGSLLTGLLRCVHEEECATSPPRSQLSNRKGPADPSDPPRSTFHFLQTLNVLKNELIFCISCSNRTTLRTKTLVEVLLDLVPLAPEWPL
ncbi:hypothetical protein NDU88_004033 [Pleurodeles waltl]|uniref:Uncharacterized protein n=1 Tax=Pleurodeles waltl TaxID=8319 RepID=A0AAV7UE71_PLEWA|nr:hypothetical protein NDU88_004033 [Pleurodeles waltl]